MKPMLAVNAPSLDKLPYPQLASPKLDGIRCIMNAQGKPLSRSLKPIRNKDIVGMLTDPGLAGLDGELVVGDPNASNCMSATTSGVMSYDKPLRDDQWKFYIFDKWDRGPGMKYSVASEILTRYADHPQIEVVPQHWCDEPQPIEDIERHYLDNGYEGLILRRPDGLYKFGRSTVREGYLLKLKRFVTDEGVVTSFHPLYHNANEAEIDNLGNTKRSKDQSGLIALNTLGALVCKGRNPYKPDEQIDFKVGTGFTADERAYLWEGRESLIGQTVTYKYFPTGGVERPRHPVFVSFRDLEDMS
jgi:DNA ligase-1